MALQLELNDQFTLAMVIEKTTPFISVNIRVLLEMRPDLASDSLLLQDMGKLRINTNTFTPEYDATTYLMFRTQEAKVAFMQYLDEIKNRYDWDLNDSIPLYKGTYVNGYILPHHNYETGNIYGIGRIEDYRDKWEWILGNCTSKVQWSTMFWYFESQADAAIFKLNFPPDKQ